MAYVVSKDEIKKELLQCGKSPAYFINNYVKISHPVKGLIPFKLYPFQKNTLKDLQDYRFNVILKARQMGISTLVAAYCLWLMLFYRDKNIMVVATKFTTAGNLVKKVRRIYTTLPSWLKIATIAVDNQISFRFDNGSEIKASPVNYDAGRSEALSLLVIDECVSGDTKVRVRNKKTGEIREIEIQQLYSNEEYK